MDTNQPTEKASQKIKESGESLKKALTLQFVLIAICFLTAFITLYLQSEGTNPIGIIILGSLSIIIVTILIIKNMFATANNLIKAGNLMD